MDEKLLSLPWELQLALGAGYLAYAAAYVGIRRHHQSADIFFRALAFGLLAWAVLALMPMNRPWFRAASAIGAAVIRAAAHRPALFDAEIGGEFAGDLIAQPQPRLVGIEA